MTLILAQPQARPFARPKTPGPIPAAQPAIDGPIAQSAVRVLDGDLATWLVSSADGWDGEPGRPEADLSILAVLSIGLALDIRSLRGSLRSESVS